MSANHSVLDVHTLPATATLAGYDRWSASYDTDDNPLVAATAWVLDQAPLAVVGARVLELGCGTGRHAAWLLASGAHAYTGVDGSAGMLDRARARLTDERVRWVHADLCTAPAPLPAGTFDLALVVLVVEHLADLAPLAAIARAALRPGGSLRIVELHPQLLGGGTVAHFRDGDTEVRFASVAHDVGTLTATLAAAGLPVETSRAWPADDAMIAAVPRLAKHRDRPVVLDLTARAS